MKNPRINLPKFDKSIHKIVYFITELQKLDEEEAKVVEEIRSRKNKIYIKFALLKQEFVDDIEWNGKNGGE